RRVARRSLAPGAPVSSPSFGRSLLPRSLTPARAPGCSAQPRSRGAGFLAVVRSLIVAPLPHSGSGRQVAPRSLAPPAPVSSPSCGRSCRLRPREAQEDVVQRRPGDLELAHLGAPRQLGEKRPGRAAQLHPLLVAAIVHTLHLVE